MGLLAGMRERRDRNALEQTALAMIECVQALVLDLDELGAPALKAQLRELRANLANGDVASAHGATLEFARREREYLEHKDAELHRIIRVLTEGLAGITLGAAAYHKQLLETGTRFEAASKLADLQQIRAAITDEVHGLRAAVQQRQAAEHKATAALRAEVESLRGAVETANVAARTDKLTGAANRAAFDDVLARACAAGEFSLLLCDIDHFKSINDQHGHMIGDRVLQGLVSFLKERVRAGDVVARWGGEEFAVLLPKANARAALAKAKSLVEELAEAEWTIDANKKLKFTMSVGVVGHERDEDPASIIDRADRCLYVAKGGGRNRAVKG